MQSDHVIIRHSSMPVTGTKDGANFAFPGNALSASTFKLHISSMPTARVKYARWILVWNPQVSDPTSPTGARLVSMDDGPSNIQQIGRIDSPAGVTYVTPRTNEVDVTDALNALLVGGIDKQLGHQTYGNGSNGCLIYSSSVEIVWE